MSTAAAAPEVVVVGGGPGGSTTAWLLARAGRRVLVLDAARFPRVKLCAGWVTHACLADLELDPAAYPHTLQPFESVALEVGDGAHETRWARVAGYGIVRAEFDAYLLARAAAAGATVREGVRVRRVGRDAGGIELHLDDERLRVPLVVGAAGHQCPVARAFGDTAAGEAVVVTQESETRLGADLLRRLSTHYGTPELVAEPDFHGYGWYFTKGDFLNVGVGAQGGASVHQRLERLRARLASTGRLPGDLALTPFRGHAYAVRRDRPRRLAGDGFLLVGDAAGLARDVSGEGIGPAVRSARLAAEAVLAGDPSRYAERVDAALGRPSPLMGALVRHAPGRIITSAARLACTVPWARRRILLEGAFGMG